MHLSFTSGKKVKLVKKNHQLCRLCSHLYISTTLRRARGRERVKMEQKYSQFRGQPRLPKFAVPKRYDIKLKPDLVACKFSGAVDISVDVVAPTKFIVLNAADLAVHPNSVRFTDQTGSKVWPDLEYYV